MAERNSGNVTPERVTPTPSGYCSPELGGYHQGVASGERDQLLQIMASMNNLMATMLNKETTSNNFQVMPDMSKSIETFDGEKDAINAREWLEGIEASAKLYRWPEAVMLETARIHLKGAARNWMIVKRDKITNWNDFCEHFKKTFYARLSKGERWDRMRSRLQKSGESCIAYVHEKLKMCQDLELELEDTVDEVIRGLYYREIRQVLRITKYKDEDELVESILKLEAQNASDAKRHFENDRKSARVVSAEKRVVNSTDSIENKSDEKSKTHVKCFKCKQVGHYASNCPIRMETVQCYQCKQTGHLKRDCPKNNGPGEVVNLAEDSGGSDNKYLKWVYVNKDIKLKGLIDSGSALCAIKKKVVDYYQLPTMQGKKNIYAFGNMNTPSITCQEFIKTTICVDEVEVNDVIVWIVPDVAQSADLLIGRTFTDDPEIAFCKINNKLKFGYVFEDPFKNILLNEDVVSAGESELIKPNEQVLLLTVEEAKEKKNDITKEMLMVDKRLTENEIDELLTLLRKYRVCFSLSLDELGYTDLVKVNIKDSGEPVRSKPYKTSAADREEIKNIVREWKRVGFVSETSSPYAAPVLLVAKKTGEKRMVVDYRKLNLQTPRINYPIPTVDEQFEKLAGCHMFSTLDLSNGYLQLPITEESKHKTSFITEDETGEFNRLVFGLKNAPFEFQNCMNVALSNVKSKLIVNYLDDILVPAVDFKDMLYRLECVLRALADAKLTLKITKCEFGKREVDYLGFVVSAGEIRPGFRKTRAINEFPVPKNGHDVKRFLGLTGYFRKFVRDYAIKARPLSNLTKGGEKFVWAEEQDDAFQNLKGELIGGAVLKLYDPTKYTELHTDASSQGLAGMLLQRDEEQCAKEVEDTGETNEEDDEEERLTVGRNRRMIKKPKKFDEYELY